MEHSWTYRIIRDGILIVFGLFLVLAFLNVRVPYTAPKGNAQAALRTMTMRINDHPITVEIAESADEHAQGLSFRTSTAPDAGMVFLFSSPQPQRFWMYGMQFPLDIIFIRNGRVVDYEEHVPAPKDTQNNPAVITSLEEADMVLELNAGKAQELGIALNTEVEFEK